jgi:hypothetical protein
MTEHVGDCYDFRRGQIVDCRLPHVLDSVARHDMRDAGGKWTLYDARLDNGQFARAKG